MKRSAKIAGVIALVVLVGLALLMRVTNHVPIVIALATFCIAFVVLMPRNALRSAPEAAATPPAAAELEDAGRRLASLSGTAPAEDQPLFEHMALLMQRLARHHRLNPDHAPRTQRFRRHVVGRMVEAVAAYVELTRRATPEQRERLADISTRIEAFVPVLERIDQACVENDLTALEVNVEVLNEQLDRRGGT